MDEKLFRIRNQEFKKTYSEDIYAFEYFKKYLNIFFVTNAIFSKIKNIFSTIIHL